MNRYRSRSGKQEGVTGYETGKDYIIIKFREGPVYKYSYISCGKEHVMNMIMCATDQLGLSTYISQHHPQYEWKR